MEEVEKESLSRTAILEKRKAPESVLTLSGAFLMVVEL